MQKAVHSGLPFVVQKNENMEVYYGRRKYEYNSYNRKTKSTGNYRQAGGRMEKNKKSGGGDVRAEALS